MVSTKQFVSQAARKAALLKGNYTKDNLYELGLEILDYSLARSSMTEHQEEALRTFSEELLDICDYYILDPLDISEIEQQKIFEDIADVIERVYGTLERVE